MTDISEKKPSRIRFSVIDLVIVLLILACAGGLVLRYGLADKLFSKTELKQVQIVFVAEAVTPDQDAVFTENTVFYHEGERFGILTAAASEQALVYRENDNGALISYHHDTLRDLRGTFACEAMETDNGYLLNGTSYVAAGSVFTVKAENVSVTVTVIGVKSLAE